MSFVMSGGLTLYFIIIFTFVFIVITVYAIIKNFNKKSMEILFKKPFYKDKPEDIKNKILNGL